MLSKGLKAWATILTCLDLASYVSQRSVLFSYSQLPPILPSLPTDSQPTATQSWCHRRPDSIHRLYKSPLHAQVSALWLGMKLCFWSIHWLPKTTWNRSSWWTFHHCECLRRLQSFTFGPKWSCFVSLQAGYGSGGFCLRGRGHRQGLCCRSKPRLIYLGSPWCAGLQ